ncbi:helix-turn-helix domain-containing protein [Nocardia alni]|uniref:helix-turn-helix domain-containing protein n=1 Tax=Nocardia alni TaxID=2815723 RepID=UPI001C24F80A|nr:AraC family transcriptional regulator [Nocardia alni]
MTYEPVDRGASSVEVMTFERLREINDSGTQRADFHVLALIDEGDGTVTVDFVAHPLSAWTAVWISPGAVHRWDDIADVAGHLVLFVPTAPVTHRTRELVASPDLVARWAVPAEARPFVDAARRHLVLEAAALAEDPSTELPQILLSALITRVEPPHSEARSANPTFQLFRSSVEAHFRTHHDADYYARTLGFAPRTLSRAVQQVTGRTAKAYIVERIVLEAKRLLAHERVTAARCASQLGFPDPSNFSLFFQNATGVRPGAWQAATIRD